MEKYSVQDYCEKQIQINASLPTKAGGTRRFLASSGTISPFFKVRSYLHKATNEQTDFICDKKTAFRNTKARDLRALLHNKY